MLPNVHHSTIFRVFSAENAPDHWLQLAGNLLMCHMWQSSCACSRTSQRTGAGTWRPGSPTTPPTRLCSLPRPSWAEIMKNFNGNERVNYKVKYWMTHSKSHSKSYSKSHSKSPSKSHLKSYSKGHSKSHSCLTKHYLIEDKPVSNTAGCHIVLDVSHMLVLAQISKYYHHHSNHVHHQVHHLPVHHHLHKKVSDSVWQKLNTSGDNSVSSSQNEDTMPNPQNGKYLAKYQHNYHH